MPPNLTTKTNDELLDIIDDGSVDNFLFTAAVTELKNRISSAEYGLYKGFEHPTNPPANP